MGCVMKVYRDWQLAGDDAALEPLWPHVRRSLEFCWIAGGWDADQDGVMEGAQHNTMDVEYYGPNPQMGLWYLGALQAAEEMARHLGETALPTRASTCSSRGSAWIDAHLFNGEYYEHQIRPPASADAVAPSLLVGMGADDITKPDYPARLPAASSISSSASTWPTSSGSAIWSHARACEDDAGQHPEVQPANRPARAFQPAAQSSRLPAKRRC